MKQMKRQHKTLIAVGLVFFLAAWFAWSVLLTADEVSQPPPVVEQVP
ncbi:MAG: hypothetical protein ABI629_01475 [bacterium]